MTNRVEEKRRYLRVNIPLEIEYILPNSDRRCTATTKDISALGVRFSTKEKLSEDANLEVTLKLPNAQNPVHLIGRVAWSKKFSSENEGPYDIGIEFLKIDEDNKNTFLKYLCDVIYG